MKAETKKKFKIPHVFVLLSSIALIVAISSYFIPAGAYARIDDPVTGRSIIDATSFQYLEKTPITFMQYITAFTAAFQNASSIICMTLVVGGTFGIINKLGLITAALSSALKVFSKNKRLAVPALIFVFAIFDSFMGAPELCIIFLPMVIPLIISLGWDTMTACAIVICGNCIGYSTGMGNPFTTIISQKTCQLPLYSGIWYRAICFVVFYIVTVWYIDRYTRKIEKNPLSSKTFQDDEVRRKDATVENGVKLNFRTKLAAVFVVCCFVFNIVGVMKLGWDIAEMTGLFLVMSVGCGIISGHTLSDTCKMFLDGAKDILFGALVMSFARSITVLMTECNIMDTIVHALSGIATSFPAFLSVFAVLIIATLIGFPISSGSGEALTVMPLFSPLADILKISKQTTVLAFQFGDGWSNIIYPTNASYMATLAVGKVNWIDWERWALPLFGIWFGLSVVMLAIAQMISLGPF